MSENPISIPELRGRFNALTEQCQEIFSEYDRMHVEYKDMRSRYEAMSARIASFESENAALAANVREERTGTATLREMLDPDKLKVADAKKELRQLRGELDRVNATKDSTLREIDRLNSEQRLVELQANKRVAEANQKIRAAELEARRNLSEIQAEIEEKRALSSALDEDIELTELGLYEPTYKFRNEGKYRDELRSIRTKQKERIKNFTTAAAKKAGKGTVSEEDGRTAMANSVVRLAIRCLNSECDTIVKSITVANSKTAHDRIDKAFDDIDNMLAPFGVSLPSNYRQMKHKEATLAVDYAYAKEKEKADKKAAAEQAREEKRLAAEKAKAEREAAKAREEEEKRAAEEARKAAEAEKAAQAAEDDEEETKPRGRKANPSKGRRSSKKPTGSSEGSGKGSSSKTKKKSSKLRKSDANSAKKDDAEPEETEVETELVDEEVVEVVGETTSEVEEQVVEDSDTEDGEE